jgi:hypothetical protein
MSELQHIGLGSPLWHASVHFTVALTQLQRLQCPRQIHEGVTAKGREEDKELRHVGLGSPSTEEDNEAGSGAVSSCTDDEDNGIRAGISADNEVDDARSSS